MTTDRTRMSKLLSKHIEIRGEQPLYTDLLDTDPSPADLILPCWIWIGAFRPRIPDPTKTNQFGLIDFPRPITTIGGKERHPAKPLMAISCDPIEPEPNRIFRKCEDRRCVNPYHHRVVHGEPQLRSKFP